MCQSVSSVWPAYTLCSNQGWIFLHFLREFGCLLLLFQGSVPSSFHRLPEFVPLCGTASFVTHGVAPPRNHEWNRCRAQADSNSDLYARITPVHQCISRLVHCFFFGGSRTRIRPSGKASRSTTFHTNARRAGSLSCCIVPFRILWALL